MLHGLWCTCLFCYLTCSPVFSYILFISSSVLGPWSDTSAWRPIMLFIRGMKPARDVWLFRLGIKPLCDDMRLSVSDEQEVVQKRTFTKWINSHLAKVRLLLYVWLQLASCPFWMVPESVRMNVLKPVALFTRPGHTLWNSHRRALTGMPCQSDVWQEWLQYLVLLIPHPDNGNCVCPWIWKMERCISHQVYLRCCSIECCSFQHADRQTCVALHSDDVSWCVWVAGKHVEQSCCGDCGVHGVFWIDREQCQDVVD